MRAVQDDDAERCIACGKPFKVGDKYLPDESGGFVHFEALGPERESFTLNGEPLGPDDPIPTPLIWSE